MTYIGTTHNSPKGGSGQHKPKRRYAWPSRVKTSKDGAFLKGFGSRSLTGLNIPFSDTTTLTNAVLSSGALTVYNADGSVAQRIQPGESAEIPVPWPPLHEEG